MEYIYKFLELMIKKSEEKFKLVHEKYVKFTQKEKNIYDKNIQKKNLFGINEINKKGISNNNDNEVSLYYEEAEENSELITFDFHNHHNPVLLRQFYEALIRAAYAKYYNSDMKLFQKIELLISRFNIKDKGKSGDKSIIEKSKSKKISKLQSKSIQNSLNSSQNDLNSSIAQTSFLGPDGNVVFGLEQKYKNAEHVKIDSFIIKYAMLIKPLFIKLYYVQNEQSNFRRENTKINEKTLFHRFIFNNLVKKSEIVSQFYGKREQYCDFITYYFREKKIGFKNKLEQYKYYENLFDLEIVFYEFCEFVYMICSKYINSNQLNPDEEKGYLFIINHLTQIIRGNNEFKNKVIIKQAKFNYTYPVLNSHITKKIQEDEKIRLEQIKLINRLEKMRTLQERKNFKENDENVRPKEEEEDFISVNKQEELEDSDDY